MILHDTTINQLASKAIEYYDELLLIGGIGKTNFNIYGKELFNILFHNNSKNINDLIDYDKEVECLFVNENILKTYIVKKTFESYKPIEGGAYGQKIKLELSSDAKIEKNEITDKSPLGRAIMYKSEGDIVKYRVDGKLIEVKILKVKN